MVNVSSGKCAYCQAIGSDLSRANEDVYSLFQEHKRYTRNAIFCPNCLERAQQKVDRRKQRAINSSSDQSSRSISSANSSEPIVLRRNVARRTGGRPGKRPAEQSPRREGPPRQPTSPQARPSAQAAPSAQARPSPQARPSAQAAPSPQARPSAQAGPSRPPKTPRATNRSPAKTAPQGSANQPERNRRTVGSSQETTTSSGDDPNTQHYSEDNRIQPNKPRGVPTRHIQPTRPLDPNEMGRMTNSERNAYFNQYIRGGGG